MKIDRVSVLLLGFLGSVSSFAGSFAGVGVGITHPTSSTALIQNAAGLASGTGAQLAGQYRFADVDEPFASATLSTEHLALGADYRREPLGRAQHRYIVQGGAALKVSVLSVGATVRKHEFGRELDVDAGAILDVGLVRFAAVGRGVRNTVNRLDLGIGLALPKMVKLGFDVKLPWPRDHRSNDFLLDFSASIDVMNLSLGLGYDVSHTAAGYGNGQVHAGVSIELLPMFYIEGFYRPISQEWNVDNFVAGGRLAF